MNERLLSCGMIEFIFENLPDINKVNAALHDVTKGSAVTGLDCVINSMEEMLNTLMGTTHYVLSVPFEAVTEKSIADALVGEANDYLERRASV